MKRIPTPHVTLCYVGNTRNSWEWDAWYSHLPPGSVKRIFDTLTRGTKSTSPRWEKVALANVTWNSRVVVGEVELSKALPCATRHPHITIAKIPSAAPTDSNTLLNLREGICPTDNKVLLTPPIRLFGTVEPVFMERKINKAIKDTR